MLLALLMTAAEADPALKTAEDFDLARLPRTGVCGEAAGADIVVCASRSLADQQRIRPLDRERFEDRPVRAEIGVGSARASAVVEQKELPGAISNRVMVKLKLPF